MLKLRRDSREPLLTSHPVPKLRINSWEPLLTSYLSFGTPRSEASKGLTRTFDDVTPSVRHFPCRSSKGTHANLR
ncbi:unnamed protein product [Prunus armeniaca]